MDLTRFRSMVENGYSFGSAPEFEDYFPHLSLDECSHEFTMDCINANISLYESIGAEHDRETAAVFKSLTEGVEIDYVALDEEAKEGVLAKIKKFFERIKNFLSSLISKLKMHIDKMFADNEKIVNKYKNSEAFNDTEALRALKFNGPGLSAEPFNKSATGITVSDLIDYTHPESIVNSSAEEINAEIEKISDQQSAARVANIVKKVTGLTVDGATYKKDLADKMFGESVEIPYGKGFFTKQGCETILLAKKSYDEILKGYKDLHDKLNKEQAALEKSASYIKSQQLSSGDKKEDKAAGKNLTGYINKYLGLYNEAMGVVNVVHNLRQKFNDARMSQAKKMYFMMLAAKKPKAKKEDVEFDVFDLDYTF